MSISVNCCEGIRFQKVMCNCQWRRQKHESKEQIMYTDRNEQIVILSTPHIEIPDLVLYHDIQNTDIVIFSTDAHDEVRFTALQGRNLFQSIDTTPPPVRTSSPKAADTAHDGPAAPHSSARAENSRGKGGGGGGGGGSEHKSHPSIASPEDVAGRTLKDVLPEFMLKFLLPICKETLNGKFLQLTIMWGGFTQLVRTYPIPDYKRRIVAGMLTMSPFVSAFNVDVNRFSLGTIADQPPLPSPRPPCTGLTALASLESVVLPAHALSHDDPHAFDPEKRGSKPEVMVMK